jgi:hypothetical protein
VKADARTPGCQSCHGASLAHQKNIGGSYSNSPYAVASFRVCRGDKFNRRVQPIRLLEAIDVIEHIHACARVWYALRCTRSDITLEENLHRRVIPVVFSISLRRSFNRCVRSRCPAHEQAFFQHLWAKTAGILLRRAVAIANSNIRPKPLRSCGLPHLGTGYPLRRS